MKQLDAILEREPWYVPALYGRRAQLPPSSGAAGVARGEEGRTRRGEPRLRPRGRGRTQDRRRHARGWSGHSRSRSATPTPRRAGAIARARGGRSPRTRTAIRRCSTRRGVASPGRTTSWAIGSRRARDAHARPRPSAHRSRGDVGMSATRSPLRRTRPARRRRDARSAGRPRLGDPRITLAVALTTWTVFGQTFLYFNRDLGQILTALGVACLADMLLALVLLRQVLVPISAYITGLSIGILLARATTGACSRWRRCGGSRPSTSCAAATATSSTRRTSASSPRSRLLHGVATVAPGLAMGRRVPGGVPDPGARAHDDEAREAARRSSCRGSPATS